MSINSKLDEIVNLNRIPPITWVIVGFALPVANIVYVNSYFLYFSTILFIFYGCCNLLFELSTFHLNVVSSNFQLYTDFTFHNKLTVSNYLIYPLNKIIDNSKNPFICEFETLDNTRISIELSIYSGNIKCIKKILFLIYTFGITSRNYTYDKDIEYFKTKKMICFV
jgi:hypothetical protein